METIDRYTDDLVFSVRMQKVLGAAKTLKKDGKGNSIAKRYLMDVMRTASRREFLYAILS